MEQVCIRQKIKEENRRISWEDTRKMPLTTRVLSHFDSCVIIIMMMSLYSTM